MKYFLQHFLPIFFTVKGVDYLHKIRNNKIFDLQLFPSKTFPGKTFPGRNYCDLGLFLLNGRLLRGLLL